jgi:hypothetical protein
MHPLRKPSGISKKLMRDGAMIWLRTGAAIRVIDLHVEELANPVASATRSSVVILSAKSTTRLIAGILVGTKYFFSTFFSRVAPGEGLMF